jgi:Protein of unknown function (DUF2568)
MVSKLSTFNLALRGIMEASIVAAFGYWGYHIGKNQTTKILFAMGAPVIGFGFWGIVDFHQAGKFSEILRLIQELIISGLAAAALFFAGQPTLGWILAALSVVHHCMVYILREKLLKKK